MLYKYLVNFITLRWSPDIRNAGSKTKDILSNFQSVWVVSFKATVLLDVDYGLAVAVIYGIVTVVARSQRSVYYALLDIGFSYLSLRKHAYSNI